MRTKHISLFAVFSIWVFAVWANARPLFVVMDVGGTVNAPEHFGYQATASRLNGQTKFIIYLDALASRSLKSARIFFHTQTKEPQAIGVKITYAPDGTKWLSFAIPTEQLSYCVLDIRSGPLRPEDKEVINDFGGYRLRLDNITLDQPTDSGYRFQRSVKVLYAGWLQNGKVYMGFLDKDGNFIPASGLMPQDINAESMPGFSGPDYKVINRPLEGRSTEPVYEYRSGMLIEGELTSEGKFVPREGARIISLKHYDEESHSRIYNLPGQLVKITEELPQKTPTA